MKSSTDTRIELGVIGKPRGLRGGMLFWPHDSTSDAIFGVDYLYIEDTRHTILEARSVSKGIELMLEGITTPELAKTLTHAKVSIEKIDLPPLEDKEYYLEDLRGLRVEDEEGVVHGEVIGFTETGAQTLLDIRVAPGKIILVPAIPEFIVKVEPKVRVVIRTVEGLFE